MTDVVLDLETMGKTAGCAIVQIGAVAFDRFKQEIVAEIDIPIDLASCQSAGLTIDAGTVLWWLWQSDDARHRIATATRHSIAEGLSLYRSWLQDWCDKHTRIWSHSPSFDAVILGAAYTKLGWVIPWHYRQERCSRTLLDIADVALSDHRQGVMHSALDDARTQAKAVMQAWRNLAERRP
jgi:hypothetical protein